MRSIRSTISSGVGTQITSLPCWPTCGSYGLEFCAKVDWMQRAATSAKASRRNVFISILGMRARGAGPETTGSLQHLRRMVRQAGPLASGKRHVAGMFPALEAVDHVGEAGGALGQVRRVDLG